MFNHGPGFRSSDVLLSVIKRDRIKLSPELYEVSVMFLALF